MKTKFRLILLVMFVLGAGVMSLQAQDNKQEMKEKMKALKISFITEKLALTSDEATAFWPVYNAYEDELKALRGDGNGKPDIANMSDAELDRLVDAKFVKEQSILNIKKSYHSEFKKVLPIQKVVMLYEAERGFKREILSKMKGNGPKPPQE